MLSALIFITSDLLLALGIIFFLFLVTVEAKVMDFTLFCPFIYLFQGGAEREGERES